MASQLDRLTAQERHLLRLLAQGHTAKTIASSEGLSVNAVNERLRSARRKTGAVSSRELARLIDGQAAPAPQEIRHKLIDVDGASSSPPTSRSDAARGAGSKVVWGSVMIVGVLAAGAMAVLVLGRAGTGTGSGTEARKVQDFPVPIHGAGGPARAGWTVMSSADNGPAITYLVPVSESSNISIPSIVLACRMVSLSVTLRGFTPDNAWPQPALTTRIGEASRVGPPEVTASGDRPALRYSFAIADEVLEPLTRGEAITFEFKGETVKPPTIPEAMRLEFAERCGSLVHPGMRRRGAANDRVY